MYRDSLKGNLCLSFLVIATFSFVIIIHHSKSSTCTPVVRTILLITSQRRHDSDQNAFTLSYRNFNIFIRGSIITRTSCFAHIYWVTLITPKINIELMRLVHCIPMVGWLVLWYLAPLSTIYQLYRCGQFHWWWKRSTRRIPQTCRKSLTNILSHNVVSSTSRLSEVRTHNVSGDMH